MKRIDCRVCKSKNLKMIWDFGMTPLANSYVTDIDKPELFFTLKVNQCQKCTNVQLAHVVNPDLLFKHYLYASSASPLLIKHFEDFAQKMGKKNFVIDIGGNDGILLKPFEKLGSKVLNVDPSDIECSVPKLREFFTTDTARTILKEYGKADLITACNVFAHIDDLDEIVEGVKLLLSDGGQFVIEVADLEQMLADGTFDLVYHEHLNFWSEKAFRKFFELRNMQISEVKHISTQGGSLRVYVKQN